MVGLWGEGFPTLLGETRGKRRHISLVFHRKNGSVFRSALTVMKITVVVWAGGEQREKKWNEKQIYRETLARWMSCGGFIWSSGQQQLAVTETKVPQLPHASQNLGLQLILCWLLPVSLQSVLTFLVICRCSCERRKQILSFFLSGKTLTRGGLRASQQMWWRDKFYWGKMYPTQAWISI